jgi:hypothetical protein
MTDTDDFLREKYGITEEVKKAWAETIRRHARKYYDETLTEEEVVDSEAFRAVVHEHHFGGIEYIADWDDSSCRWRFEWRTGKRPYSAFDYESASFVRELKTNKITLVSGCFYS